MKTIHVGFQDHLFEQLEAVASEDNMSRSEIIRTAVLEFLRSRSLRRKESAMRRYAETMSPHSGEFTDHSDAAVVEHLLRETEW